MQPAADFPLPTPAHSAPLKTETEAMEPDGRPEEGPRRDVSRGRRRLIRWVAIIAGVILAVLACWQDPLYAL
jgi:hypothetical protein